MAGHCPTSGLSASLESKLKYAAARATLQNILTRRSKPPQMVNTPRWRTFRAAELCALDLMETAVPEHRVLVTITTRCRGRKVSKPVTKRVSRIIAKHLAPACLRYVWFFHRSSAGFIHFHVCAEMRDAATTSSVPNEDTALFMRSMAHMGCKVAFPKPDTEPATKLRTALSLALSAAGIGHHVDIQIVEAPSRLVPYLARYLRGVAECDSRYFADYRIRLWGASKNAAIANAKLHIVTKKGCLRRMKMAAYLRSRGCQTLSDAKEMYGPKFVYQHREEIGALRLKAYPNERSFFEDWGCIHSPEALGIEIWDPAYDRANREWIYDSEQPPDSSDPETVAALKNAYVLTKEAWLSHSTPLFPRTSQPSRPKPARKRRKKTPTGPLPMPIKKATKKATKKKPNPKNSNRRKSIIAPKVQSHESTDQETHRQERQLHAAQDDLSPRSPATPLLSLWSRSRGAMSRL